MAIQRRLGRGLEALLAHPFGSTGENEGGVAIETHDQPQEVHQQYVVPASGLNQISVYEIDGNPAQPRQDIDESEIDLLAQSLREHGLIQPIVVRRLGDRYQLIAGERRLRAAIKAGWPEVPAQVRDADDRQVAELAIVENLQRKDLNALEKAESFQQYLQHYHCTQEELASRLSIDRSTVANLIRLLELPEEVRQAVRGSAISAGHARALLPLGDESEQIKVCRRVQNEGLSVRVVEELVKETIRESDGELLAVVDENGESHPVARTRSEHLSSMEQELRSALGTKIQISQSAKGRGKITIHFANHAEFDRLRTALTQGNLPKSQAG
ncbi:MAG: ParB/RepB/Spo0J family partition protein [Pirellulales bacterium]|nr:ParB/RepB/Spo0J family partition protein [Pirellulales bacterium]